ncbi:MAG: tRNA pseudouridine(38-40) synthase TruA [Myxococcota bacterium]|nr:tRNA pseudouridine(38-40) synthase TruA [Myxococcota bacterium]
MIDGKAHCVLLELSYDGTGFHGWARQKNARTVEGTLSSAVLGIDPGAGLIRGASRTDAGVHAEGQLAAFDSTLDIPARGWVLGLNQRLPDDVAVRAAHSVSPGFSPRFAARGKRYRYRLLVDPVRDPRWRTRAWRVPELDVRAMSAEANAARGLHNFASFRATGDARATTARTLTRVHVEREADPRIIAVVVEGDAFLYHMVRILVGTMVDVARGRLAAGAIARAISAGDRRSAGTTAPAHGLVLERVSVDVPDSAGERWPP